VGRDAYIQASFAGGEISPRLHGRADIVKYQTGAETLENFIVRPEGGLQRRHGTRYAGDCKSPSAVSRLVAFIFSTEQAYIIEFGNLYARFWKPYGVITNESNSITAITKANPGVVTYSGTDNFANGDRVVISGVSGMTELNGREFEVANVNTGANTFELLSTNTSSYGTYTTGGTISKIVQITTPYTSADLAALSFAQSADTLWIASGSHAPRTLTRTSDVAWTLSAIDLAQGPFTAINTDASKSVLLSITGTNYDPGDTGTMRAASDIFTANDVGSFFYIEEQYYSDKAVYPYGNDRPNTVNAVVGAQFSNDGKVYECVAAVGGNLSGQIFPTHEIGEAWDSPVGATSRAKFRYLHSRFVIVEITAYTDAKTVSIKLKTRCPNGLDPDTVNISDADNNGAGLIQITSNGHGYGLGDWVRINNVAGTTEANGNWRITNVTTNTFDLEGSTFVNAYIAGSDTAQRFASFKWRRSAFSASRGYPRAVTLHEQRLCWGGTSLEPFGVWLSKSGDFYNHLPGTKDDDAIQYNIAAPQVNVIRWLDSSDNLIIGTLAQEFAAYGGGLGDPITPTNTRITPQSSEGSAAIQPVRAGNETVFVNRSSRKIYAMDFEVAGGQYVSIDLTELVNHFTANATYTQIAWARNPASTLWALRSDGVLCSLTYRKDQQVFAWARHPLSDGTVESIAVIPTDDGTADDLWMIVKRTVNGTDRRYVEYLAPAFEPQSNTDTDLMGFVDSGLRYNGSAVSALSGLFHLEGKTVKVVTNGALHPDCVVSGGRITLNTSTTNAWVGLGYTSKLKTLRPEVPSASGTVQGKIKRVSRVTVRVLNSLGGRASDAEEAVWENLLHRDMADLMDAEPKLKTGDFDVDLSSDYASDGRFVILQTDPLPMDILCVMPNLTVSEA
jgi:hypothetical protein